MLLQSCRTCRTCCNCTVHFLLSAPLPPITLAPLTMLLTWCTLYLGQSTCPAPAPCRRCLRVQRRLATCPPTASEQLAPFSGPAHYVQRGARIAVWKSLARSECQPNAAGVKHTCHAVRLPALCAQTVWRGCPCCFLCLCSFRRVRIDHVGFGLVLGDDGKKFRSRSGDVSGCW